MSLLPELMKFNDQLDEQNEWTKNRELPMNIYNLH